MDLRKLTSQRGQIALVVILVMIVIGTVALAVVSRSITNISLTTQEASKIRAFSGAEAGIEDLLNQGLAGKVGTAQSGTIGSGEKQISYQYEVTEM